MNRTRGQNQSNRVAVIKQKAGGSKDAVQVTIAFLRDSCGVLGENTIVVLLSLLALMSLLCNYFLASTYVL